MSETEASREDSDSPAQSAVDQLTTISEALPYAVRSVTGQLSHLGLECRVLRNGWVIYAVDLLGPDVAVRPAREEGAIDPCLTACAVWEISEGAYRWVRPIVEGLDGRYPRLDFTYVPEKGTVWVSRNLIEPELSAEGILEGMWGVGDACAEAWRQIAALGLGRRFHSAWLSEDLLHGEKTLAQLRREMTAASAPGREDSSADSDAGSSSAAVA